MAMGLGAFIATAIAMAAGGAGAGMMQRKQQEDAEGKRFKLAAVQKMIAESAEQGLDIPLGVLTEAIGPVAKEIHPLYQELAQQRRKAIQTEAINNQLMISNWQRQQRIQAGEEDDEGPTGPITMPTTSLGVPGMVPGQGGQGPAPIPVGLGVGRGSLAPQFMPQPQPQPQVPPAQAAVAAQAPGGAGMLAQAQGNVQPQPEIPGLEPWEGSVTPAPPGVPIPAPPEVSQPFRSRIPRPVGQSSISIRDGKPTFHFESIKPEEWKNFRQARTLERAEALGMTYGQILREFTSRGITPPPELKQIGENQFLEARNQHLKSIQGRLPTQDEYRLAGHLAQSRVGYAPPGEVFYSSPQDVDARFTETVMGPWVGIAANPENKITWNDLISMFIPMPGGAMPSPQAVEAATRRAEGMIRTHLMKTHRHLTRAQLDKEVERRMGVGATEAQITRMEQPVPLDPAQRKAYEVSGEPLPKEGDRPVTGAAPVAPVTPPVAPGAPSVAPSAPSRAPGAPSAPRAAPGAPPGGAAPGPVGAPGARLTPQGAYEKGLALAREEERAKPVGSAERGLIYNAETMRPVMPANQGDYEDGLKGGRYIRTHNNGQDIQGLSRLEDYVVRFRDNLDVLRPHQESGALKMFPLSLITTGFKIPEAIPGIGGKEIGGGLLPDRLVTEAMRRMNIPRQEAERVIRAINDLDVLDKEAPLALRMMGQRGNVGQETLKREVSGFPKVISNTQQSGARFTSFHRMVDEQRMAMGGTVIRPSDEDVRLAAKKAFPNRSPQEVADLMDSDPAVNAEIEGRAKVEALRRIRNARR